MKTLTHLCYSFTYCLLWLQDAPGTVLKVDAVPTIFDLAPQPQTEQVKRAKETVGKYNLCRSFFLNMQINFYAL